MACGASWASSLSLPKMLNVLTLTGLSTAAVAGAEEEELDFALGGLAALPPELRRLLLMISAVATSAAITSTTTMVTATRLAPPRPSRGPRPGGRWYWAAPRPRSGSAQLLWSSAFGG